MDAYRKLPAAARRPDLIRGIIGAERLLPWRNPLHGPRAISSVRIWYRYELTLTVQRMRPQPYLALFDEERRDYGYRILDENAPVVALTICAGSSTGSEKSDLQATAVNE